MSVVGLEPDLPSDEEIEKAAKCYSGTTYGTIYPTIRAADFIAGARWMPERIAGVDPK